VFYDVLVDEKGAIRDVVLVKGAAPLLDEAALCAVRTAVYRPAEKKGVPVAVWSRIPVAFRLHH
jgi:TonB family protein